MVGVGESWGGGGRVRTTWTQAASFMALPLGLYVVAAAVSFAQVAGISELSIGWPRATSTLGYIFCIGVGVYLLDRVKLSDARLDPADAVAHPERAAFIARHSGTVRGAMLALFAIGAACAAWLGMEAGWRGWALLALEGGACVGVVLYAGRPRRVRARPKDVLIVKNACIGGAITGFVVIVVSLVALSDSPSIWPLAAMGLGAAQLFVRVVADSIICDLEDEEADRAFGTATLATRFGRRVAWNTASVMRVAVGVALIALPLGDRRAAVAWGVVTIVSTVILRVCDPRRVRDWTDLRFPLEAAAVLAWQTTGI